MILIHLTRLNAVLGQSLRRAPAYTSVRFILRGLDAAEIERDFREHAAALVPSPAGEPASPEDAAAPPAVAIDGKTLRASFHEDARHK